MPMPIEVLVTFQDNSTQLYYIPLRMMRGQKPVAADTKVLADWAWAYPTYNFTVGKEMKRIKTIQLNPTKKMADVYKANDTFTVIDKL